MRGRVGTQVYSAGTSGPYVRQWKMTSRRCTVVQAEHRARFSPWARAWEALSAPDRALWVAWAADPGQEKTNSLGIAYYISGWQWFVAVNTQLATILQGPVNVPPTSATPTTPTAPTVTLWWPENAPQRSRISFVAGEFAFGASAIVFVAGNRTLGRSAQSSHWRLGYYALQPSGLPEIFDVWLDYYIGARAAEQRLWFKTWNQNLDGNRSRGLVVSSAVVVAQ